MVRFNVRKLALRLLLAAPVLLAAPAAHAQLWIGPSAVEVRAEDQKGHDLAGAQVRLVYTSLIPKDGPLAVETDAKGRANVGGLADGAWHVEVSHEGFMTYIVDIHVRQGGRPEIGDATQYRVPGGGTNLMKVKITRGTPTAAPPRASVRPVVPAPTPAPTQPAPAAAPAQPAPAPAPAPAPMEAPKSAPVPQPTPTPPAPAPRPETQPAPAVQPTPSPKPTPAPVTPQPTAPPPVAVVPMPAPTPPPAASPTPPAEAVRLRTAQDRTCVECQPGESALSTERVIPPGGGTGCGGDIGAKLKGGSVPAGLPAGCSVLRIALPAGARYTAYRYEVQDGKDSLDCRTAQDCPNSTGRWPMDPVLLRSPQGTIILAPFESGPADRERRAVLTVYFTAGKK